MLELRLLADIGGHLHPQTGAGHVQRRRDRHQHIQRHLAQRVAEVVVLREHGNPHTGVGHGRGLQRRLHLHAHLRGSELLSEQGTAALLQPLQMQLQALGSTATHLQRGEVAVVDQRRGAELGRGSGRAVAEDHRHTRACAWAHHCVTRSAAGCAGAIQADCPAQACKASRRFSRAAAWRITAVSARCTG